MSEQGDCGVEQCLGAFQQASTMQRPLLDNSMGLLSQWKTACVTVYIESIETGGQCHEGRFSLMKHSVMEQPWGISHREDHYINPCLPRYEASDHPLILSSIQQKLHHYH